MPNLPSLYTQLTSASGEQILKKVEQPKEVDAGRQQVIWNWLQSTPTQELMKHLSDECTELLREAVDLAVRAPERTDKIIQNLVRVDALREVMTYGQH